MIQKLEQQLLLLSPADKPRIIQLLAQSLNILRSDTRYDSSIQLSEFFVSPLLLNLSLLENLTSAAIATFSQLSSLRSQ